MKEEKNEEEFREEELLEEEELSMLEAKLENQPPCEPAVVEVLVEVEQVVEGEVKELLVPELVEVERQVGRPPWDMLASTEVWRLVLIITGCLLDISLSQLSLLVV